jgi:CMP-N,N'-diacetyllegionaminic acid synthase
MKFLAVIPARSGSKGLPGKNTRPFHGAPLLVWSVRAANAVSRIDLVAVSSDDDGVLAVGAAAGALAVKRPAELASDTALPKDAVLHCADELKAAGHGDFDVVVLLQPTSPLRAPWDIDACLDKVVNDGFDSCATFIESDAHPKRVWKIQNDAPKPFMESGANWAPRQAIEPVYALNGAVYVVKLSAFRADPTPAFLFGRSAAVVMPPERSFDIDTLMDFEIAEAAQAILQRRANGEV